MSLSLPPQLPDRPGVYKFFDVHGTVLYIGKAKNIAKRMQHYFTPGSLWKQEMVATATRIERIETPSETDALLLEDSLIKNHLPEYNKLLRNNTNYVFLKISKGLFPTFSIVRKRYNDSSTYIGPRYGSRQLRDLLRYLRQMFQFHTMKSREFAQGVLSSDYFFQLDRGRSVIALMNDPKKQHLVEQAKKQGWKPEKSFEEYVKEYAEISHIISECFAGKTRVVLTYLKEQIAESAKKEHFERCAKLAEMYAFVEHLDASYQHIVVEKAVNGYVAYIKQVAHYYVIILLHLIEGKIVDIITTHKAKTDYDLSTLEASLGSEFGTQRLIQQTDESWLFADTSCKKLSKKARSALVEVAETSLTSYLQTTANLTTENIINDLLVQLQTEYDLQRIPLVMECIDISHLGGTHTSGGLSAYRDGLPDKSHYRQYHIQTVKDGTSDDYQALKEIIIRRFKLTKQAIGATYLPDLLVIDGGKGQLGIIVELAKTYPVITDLLQQVDIVALGKGEARQRSRKSQGVSEILYTLSPEGEIHQHPLAYHQADQLLIRLRDEAHRFANKSRKKRAEKIWKK